MYILMYTHIHLLLRMRVAKLLWTANIPAEYSHQDSPKFKKQLGILICILFPVFLKFSYFIIYTLYLYSFIQAFVFDLKTCLLILIQNPSIYSYIYAFVNSFIHSLIYLLIDYLIHLFIYSFTH
jgi:hypothetical protein